MRKLKSKSPAEGGRSKPRGFRTLTSNACLLQLKNAKIVLLEKATPKNCGAKAAACAELAKVAASADFNTPAGVCLPFGCMEAAIKVKCGLIASCWMRPCPGYSEDQAAQSDTGVRVGGAHSTMPPCIDCNHSSLDYY